VLYYCVRELIFKKMQQIKNHIKTFLHSVLYYGLGKVLYEKIVFFYSLGYWPNFANPQSFNEKTCAYKLFRVPSNAYRLADKVTVRDIVAQCIGSEYLNEVYYTGDNPDEIDWSLLPTSFVAKGNQGSGDDYFMLVEDKNKVDEQAFKKHMHGILKLRFGKLLNEHWYLQIKPQIIIEKRLISKGYAVPPDYKFFVFNGKVRMIFVASGRYENLGLTFYSPEWKKLDFSIRYPIGPDIPKPKNLQAMIELAEKFGPFCEAVRVDFYNLDDEKIVFGELTFAHGSGRYRFIPDRKYDFLAGTYWQYAMTENRQ